MLSSLHWKLIAVAVVAFAAVLATGSASATPGPCETPENNNHAGSTAGGSPTATKNISALLHCVTTNAVIPSGAGSAPSILNKFELPDMDSTTSGVQYKNPNGTGTQQCTYVTNSPPVVTNSPCVNAAGNDIPNKNTGEFGHFHHNADPCKHGSAGCQMQVEPNIDDKPEKRLIEIWAIVKDDVGGIADIASVWAEIREPDGAKKFQNQPLQLGLRPCDDLGTEQNAASPYHAAVNTGGMPHAKLNLNDCTPQNLWRPYSGTFTLNNDQPYGKYTVCVFAIDQAGNTTNPKVCNQFNVVNVVAFELSFTKVSYGAVSIGVPKSVSPGHLENTGNAKACLTADFTPMRGKQSQLPIYLFDIDLGGETRYFWTGPTADPTRPNPGQLVTPLQPKVPVKIRFSIHPVAPLAQDTYWGSVNLSVKKCANGETQFP
jgi:hypothetical protein